MDKQKELAEVTEIKKIRKTKKLKPIALNEYKIFVKLLDELPSREIYILLNMITSL